MRVLLGHNFYQQPGGEDRSFAIESALLRARGHEVIPFTRHNDELHSMSRWGAASNTIWNRKTKQRLLELLQATRPDVAHFTNTFPLLSPAVYYACREMKVPVVQSLRNFRTLCLRLISIAPGVRVKSVSTNGCRGRASFMAVTARIVKPVRWLRAC